MHVWSANWVLISYLQKYPIELYSKVLEIGCGAGIAGIYCAKTYSADVIACDASAEVFPYLYQHAAKNGVAIKTLQRDIALLTTEDLRGSDVLLGVEISAWWWIVEPLKALMQRARDAGVKRILLSDPGRQTFYAITAEYAQYIHPWYVNGKYRIYGHVYDEICK